jgi:hypothetical protein
MCFTPHQTPRAKIPDSRSCDLCGSRRSSRSVPREPYFQCHYLSLCAWSYPLIPQAFLKYAPSPFNSTPHCHQCSSISSLTHWYTPRVYTSPLLLHFPLHHIVSDQVSDHVPTHANLASSPHTKVKNVLRLVLHTNLLKRSLTPSLYEA